jgi:PilZ domain
MIEQQIDADTPAAVEARTHERHDCDLPGSCGPASSWNRPGARWGGAITNISLGGVRLRLPRRFEPGAGLAIELPDAGGGPWVVFARVARVRPDGDSWELGCEFISELGEDEFRRLLYAPPDLASFSEQAPPDGDPTAGRIVASPQPEPTDQRCHERHRSLESHVLRLAIRPAFGGRPALLSDLSAGGVGFLLDRPLEQGDVLAVELGGPDGSAPPRIAQVRHCRPCPVPADAPWLPPAPLLARFGRWLFGSEKARPEGVAWVVGCRFTRPLAEEELTEYLGQCRAAGLLREVQEPA